MLKYIFGHLKHAAVYSWSECLGLYAIPADLRENIISMVICKQRAMALWNNVLFSRGVVKITNTVKLLTTTKHPCVFPFSDYETCKIHALISP